MQQRLRLHLAVSVVLVSLGACSGLSDSRERIVGDVSTSDNIKQQEAMLSQEVEVKNTDNVITQVSEFKSANNWPTSYCSL